MADYLELVLDQGNDVTLHGTVASTATGDPVDLTGVTVEMYIKPSAVTDDDADDVTVLSTATGEITLDGGTGAYTVQVPAAALTRAGAAWYRVDTVSGGKRKSVVYGDLWVRDT